MDDDVDPRPPRIREDGVDQFPRIEDGRGGIAQQRHPRVLFGLPERPASRFPLRLHTLIERVVVVPGIAKAELTILEEGREITAEEQGREAGEDQQDDERMTHQKVLDERMTELPAADPAR